VPSQMDADDPASAPLIATALPRQPAALPSSSVMEPVVRKVVGPRSGLTLSPPELLALAKTVPFSLSDAAIGSGQLKAALQRRNHGLFAACAPPAADSKPESGGILDPRGWGGTACSGLRSAVGRHQGLPYCIQACHNWMESAH